MKSSQKKVSEPKFWLLLSLFFIVPIASSAQQRFFAPEKLIETGIYYYPEAWKTEQWERDIKKMAEMGFEFTHFAEFAWAQIEPREGEYDFKWLDRAVELAAKHNLKVIMCTPTPTPPAWLIRKYPEIAVEMHTGQTGQHGTRSHYSWSSEKYRELTVKVVEAMAKHYGNDSRIWGWQIDNEPSHYGTYDYSPAAQQAFRGWLKRKYKTIDNLNFAWGTAFWSGVYNDFDQIEIPNQNRLYSGTASPTSAVDFKRFSADECASYVSLQLNTLKSIISPLQFVTTNFMHAHTDVDPWRNQDLDFPSYTAYPVAGYSDGLGDQGFRLGDPWLLSFANDFFRPVNGITGVMEIQPGQVNWGSYNPQPYPGAIRAWLWNIFAGDLKFVCSYRFRQPLFGGEQFHEGMVNTDGVTETSGGKQYRQFMSEIKELRKLFRPDVRMPKEYAARKTAVLYNVENIWETTVQPQTYQWNQRNHITQYYNAAKLLTCPIDVIGEDADLSPYRVVVIPAFQLVDEELVEKWRLYAENGGHLVISCRTGLKDRNSHFREAKWASAITQLIGADITMNDMLSATRKAKVELDKKHYEWNVWGDIMAPYATTQVWAHFADQFYAGKPTVTHRKLGKGSVTYIGTATIDGKFEREVLKKVYQKAGITIQEQAEGVMVNWRDGFWIAVNYASSPSTVAMPKNANILIGSKTLEPAGVVVWTE